jgi:hypothetical protein
MLNQRMRMATVLLMVAAATGAVGLICWTPATGASAAQEEPLDLWEGGRNAERWPAHIRR